MGTKIEFKHYIADYVYILKYDKYDPIEKVKISSIEIDCNRDIRYGYWDERGNTSYVYEENVYSTFEEAREALCQWAASQRRD